MMASAPQFAGDTSPRMGAAGPDDGAAPARPVGPMMTFALHARDARMEWSIDVGHLIEKGLGADVVSPLRPVTPAAHADSR